MAASSSSQPHHNPLPSTPPQNSKSSKPTISRKGKGKENVVEEVQQESDDLSNSSWNWTHLTDPSACRVPPIFTKDGSYFFSLVGSSVKIHSVITGQVVSTLSAPRSSNGTSSDLLTTAILNPHNAFQLITGSLDGRLVVWDFLDAVLLQTIDIAQPIHYICAHNSFKDVVFVAASRPSKKSKSGVTDDNAVVLRVSLTPVASTTKSAEILPIGKTRFPTGLSLSPSGAWLIATASHKVYVTATSSPASGFTKYVSPERLTCLAFHPHENYFATGDDKGCIRVWYCLNNDLPVNVRGVEKKSQTTALHWHAHAVSSVAFSRNGAYLLSGGEESVLVIWQLQTGKKEFVPRLGAPISTISVLSTADSEEEYLLGLADATYLFVSSGNLKISRSYSRIKLDPATALDLPSGSRHSAPLAVHPLTSTLILPSSHPSSLQVYSPSSSKLVSELEVAPSNRVSRRDKQPIQQSYVEQVAVSLSGLWLASIDTREGDDCIRGEIYLKFWRWDTANHRWILNTRVDRPHGLKRITSLSFSPSFDNSQASQLVTTGEDANIKMWGLRTNGNKSKATEEFWTTRSCFSFRSQVPQSAAWSRDGSLLAISFFRSVALYDPFTNILRRSLTCSECRSSTSVHFIDKKGRYLAMVGAHHLILWDLVTQSVRWSYDALLTIERVVPHDQEDYFSVFHGNLESQTTRVTVFSPVSPKPLTAFSMPFGLRNCLSYSLAGNLSNPTFVGITQGWGVVLIGNNLKLAKEEGSMATEIVVGSSTVRRTLFQDIFGKSAFAESPTAPVSINGKSHSWDTEVFDRPAYLMPPLEHLFEPLISGFLKLRPEQPVTQLAPDEDVDMEEGTAEQVLVRTQRSRLVRSEEMNTFIELFKKHSVKGAPGVNGNGNGTIEALSNHTPHRSASPVAKKVKYDSNPRTRLVPDSPKPAPTSSPSIPSSIGRKRKKSLTS